jgi:hypothetical protein
MPKIPDAERASEHELAASLEGTFVSLQEHISVLQILDGTAESWPGIVCCMKSMHAIAEVVARRLREQSAALDNSVKRGKTLSEELSAAKRKLNLQAVTISNIREQRQLDADRAQELQRSFDETTADLANTRATLDDQVSCCLH